MPDDIPSISLSEYQGMLAKAKNQPIPNNPPKKPAKEEPINYLTTDPLTGEKREWGLSPETRRQLGADDTTYDNGTVTGYLANSLKPLRVGNLTANIADLGYRGMQGGKAVIDAAGAGLDDALSYTGIPQAVEKVTGMAPTVLGAVNALLEEGGGGMASLGKGGRFTSPASDTLAPEARAAINDAQSKAFAGGASADDIVKIATDKGLAPYTPEARKALDDAVAARDANKAPGAAPAPEPVKSVAERMTDALNNAKITTEKQQELNAALRKDKFQKLNAIPDDVSGQDWVKMQRAALRGKADKVEFEPVGEKFTPDEIGQLYNNIRSSPLSEGNKIGAVTGLDKLLAGQTVVPSELASLQTAFGPEFVKAAMKNRDTVSKWGDTVNNAINLPRSVVSTVDLSIPLRQGVFLSSRPEFYKSFGKMIKQAGSEKYYQESQKALMEKPNFSLKKDSGLALTDDGVDFMNRPEQFRSDWAEKIPVFKYLHKFSQRAANGFSNQLRSDVWDSIENQYRKQGIDLNENPDLARKLATYINSASGRGKVPFDKIGTLASDALFSPQLMRSRVDLLSGRFLLTKDPVLRNNYLRDLAGFGSIAATGIALAKMYGADVGTNPLSSDWGKISVPSKGGAAGVAQNIPSVFGMGVQTYGGKTRYDLFGGMQQYAHLAAVLAMAERTTNSGKTIEFGKGYKPETRMGTIGRFLRSKESPAMSLAHDALEGTDYMGNKFDLAKGLVNRMIPFSIQDSYSGYYGDDPQKNGSAKPPKMGVDGIPEISAEDYRKAKAATTPQEDKASDAIPEIDINDYKQKLRTSNTTYGNSQAVGVLSSLGLSMTDKGIRSAETQKMLASKYSGVARPGTSDHEIGNAVDFRPSKSVSPKEIVTAMSEAGFKGVRIITKKHGSGPHWHVQWDSYGDG